jgi:hypothetical protein
MSDEELQTKQFLLDWGQHCFFYSINGTIAEIVNDYLFHQRKNLTEVVSEILLFLRGDDQFKDPMFSSLARCLLSYCDLIRKYHDDSPPHTLHSSKLFYSMCVSILFIRLTFDIAARSSNSLSISLKIIPKIAQKGLIKCLSIVGFNCSDYQASLDDPPLFAQLLGQKFFLLYPDLIPEPSLLDQNHVLNFFRSNYFVSCPLLVGDLFDDIDDELHVLNPNTVSNEQIFLSREVVISQSKCPVNDGTKPVLHQSALTRRSESNILLSKSRTSPMNGHRLCMERRLQKQQTTTNAVKPKEMDSILHISKKRMVEQRTDSKNSRQRRLVIEDTPIRK